MYGEYVTIEGQTVFVLCTPGISKKELVERARKQIAQQKEIESVKGCKGQDLNCNCNGKCFTNR